MFTLLQIKYTYIIKKHIAGGIKEMPKSHEYLLWIKFDKDFFSFDNDMYLCFTHVPQHSSHSTCTAFLQMENDISRFSKLGVIFLSGDFNARTG